MVGARWAGALPERHRSLRGPENQDLKVLGDRMKVMCYTGSHVDHRTGPDWPIFVTDSQHSGTSSNKIDLILDMWLLVINRPLRPRGNRQARPRGPEEVVERWLRTVEPIKQLRQGEGIHAPGCSIRDPAFTGSRERGWAVRNRR